MGILPWSDKLSVGVGEVDAQHRQLVGHLNDLADAMAGGASREALDPLIKALAGYAKSHFATEERYMKAFRYRDYDTHKIEHDHFVAQVSEFERGFEAGKLTLSIDILKFLKSWVVTHI